MKDTFGNDRKISLSRELTKLNEETLRMTLKDATEFFEKNEPKGEFALVVEGSNEDMPKEDNSLIQLSPEEHVAHYESEGFARMDAIKKAAKDRGMSKSDFYKTLI
jgi:16S rRNA (cytidine1402-2'-O)-methyltransferase